MTDTISSIQDLTEFEELEVMGGVEAESVVQNSCSNAVAGCAGCVVHEGCTNNVVACACDKPDPGEDYDKGDKN